MAAYAAGYRAALGLGTLAGAVMRSRRSAPPDAGLGGTDGVDGTDPAIQRERRGTADTGHSTQFNGPGGSTDSVLSETDAPARPSPYPDHPSEGGRPSPRARPSGPAPPPGDGGRSAAEPADDGMALLRRAQNGDPEAFGELYSRYNDLVFRYVYYRIGDRSQAEDFTSETFLRALRRIGSFTWTGRDIGAWFVTIARNIVLDHVKSSRYRLEVTMADMLDEDRAEEGPEDAVLDRVTNAELLRCIRMLNPEQQECVILRFLHGLSVAETAAIMRKNDGAIKALQHRAVRRLATLLPEGLR